MLYVLLIKLCSCQSAEKKRRRIFFLVSKLENVNVGCNLKFSDPAVFNLARKGCGLNLGNICLVGV